jgi:hypothetical protein
MSEAMGSSAEPTVVYVRLLGEGTLVFRPAPAEPAGKNVVRLLMPAGYDPEDEEWEFKPGATVRVELRALSEGDFLVAVCQVDDHR